MLRRWLALGLAIGLVVGCQSEAPPDPVAPPDPYAVLDVPYDASHPDPLHQLDFYLPAHPIGRPPLLVFLHGGAWVGGDKHLYGDVGVTFRELGFVVAVVNYPLSRRDNAVRSPDHAKSVATALAFLSKDARGLGYDPKRVFVAGHSAGTHICGLLAASPLLTKAGVPDALAPKGFIGLSGIYDVPLLVDRFPNYRRQFVDVAIGDPTKWAAASPTRLPITCRAPWLIIHSVDDELVPIDQSRRFANHLRQSGVGCTVLELKGQSHGGTVAGLMSHQSETVAQVQRWIQGIR